jgi:hypothetical protein
VNAQVASALLAGFNEAGRLKRALDFSEGLVQPVGELPNRYRLAVLQTTAHLESVAYAGRTAKP